MRVSVRNLGLCGMVSLGATGVAVAWLAGVDADMGRALATNAAVGAVNVALGVVVCASDYQMEVVNASK
jgi:hypothetical protein